MAAMTNYSRFGKEVGGVQEEPLYYDLSSLIQWFRKAMPLKSTFVRPEKIWRIFPVYLMVVCFITPAFSQVLSDTAIVKASLKKLTGGKTLTGFRLEVDHKTPRETPLAYRQPDPMLNFLDSLMKAAPDSIKQEGVKVMEDMRRQLYQGKIDLETGKHISFFASWAARKVTQITIQPNRSKGKTDTSRAVYDFSHPYRFQSVLKYNPVWLLQYMLTDTARVNYTGTTQINARKQHIVQTRMGTRWVEVMIDSESWLPSGIVVPHVDEDPLIGRGPVLYKEIWLYSDYKNVNGFLLPMSVEEIFTRQDFTTRRSLSWRDLNGTFPDKTFEPEPAPWAKLKYSFVKLADNLFVMEESGGFFNRRFLIRLKPDSQIDLFLTLDYRKEVNARVIDAVRAHFPGLKITRIFCLHRLLRVTELAAFFDTGATVYAPKDQDERHRKLLQEDSLGNVRLAAKSLVPFELPYENDGVNGLVYFQNSGAVVYYLPAEKLIYLNGGTFGKPSPDEIKLHQLLRSEGTRVEKIVYSSYDPGGTPPPTDFPEFEKRIKAQ
ncbi:hypothetical protein GCM10023091_13650 [Ravibacter arvi]|uniref:DUF3857 domain-containing protein n=1 Tax=Ravibacter arvi TaxID=2051041 RepID=A0ABP8LUW4_9BACT